MIIGIDYGSKLAGTTAISFVHNGNLEVVQTRKKEDADHFIVQFVHNQPVQLIGMDAPLTLPLAYFNKGSDFFYRECDKELKAMSPMFLGGLTARAMKLKHKLEIKMIEVYPRARLQRAAEGIEHWYKKDLNIGAAWLMHELGLNHLPMINNWHQFDSAVALTITMDYNNGQAWSCGNELEGRIHY